MMPTTLGFSNDDGNMCRDPRSAPAMEITGQPRTLRLDPLLKTAVIFVCKSPATTA
jgi:hypothetical protein